MNIRVTLDLTTIYSDCCSLEVCSGFIPSSVFKTIPHWNPSLGVSNHIPEENVFIFQHPGIMSKRCALGGFDTLRENWLFDRKPSLNFYGLFPSESKFIWKIISRTEQLSIILALGEDYKFIGAWSNSFIIVVLALGREYRKVEVGNFSGSLAEKFREHFWIWLEISDCFGFFSNTYSHFLETLYWGRQGELDIEHDISN